MQPPERVQRKLIERDKSSARLPRFGSCCATRTAGSTYTCTFKCTLKHRSTCVYIPHLHLTIYIYIYIRFASSFRGGVECIFSFLDTKPCCFPSVPLSPPSRAVATRTPRRGLFVSGHVLVFVVRLFTACLFDKRHLGLCAVKGDQRQLFVLLERSVQLLGG